MDFLSLAFFLLIISLAFKAYCTSQRGTNCPVLRKLPICLILTHALLLKSCLYSKEKKDCCSSGQKQIAVAERSVMKSRGRLWGQLFIYKLLSFIFFNILLTSIYWFLRSPSIQCHSKPHPGSRSFQHAELFYISSFNWFLLLSLESYTQEKITCADCHMMFK